MKLFARIMKVDEARREVVGRIAQEALDKSKEIMDYEKSKPYFQSWSDEIKKASDGKSVGNVRAMHGKVAAGKLTEMIFNDDEKAIDVVSKVVDDNEWNKVLEGVYTGFSIGGSYADKKVEKMNGESVTRYVAKPNEVSLVDSPCLGSARFFDVLKSDGSTMQKLFKAVEKSEEDAAVDELVKMVPEKMKASDLLALAKAHVEKSETPTAGDPPAEEAEKKEPEGEQKPAQEAAATTETPPAADETAKGEESKDLKKGLYDVKVLADIVMNLSYLVACCESEAQFEGDNSPIPAKLRGSMKALGEALKAMTTEEIDELVAAAKSAKPGELQKVAATPSVTAEEISKMVQGELAKALEPLSKKNEELQGALAKTTEQLTSVTGELEKIKKMPAPAKGATRVVAIEKGSDGGAEMNGDKLEIQAIRKSDGSIDEAATLMKGVHALGGRKVTTL